MKKLIVLTAGVSTPSTTRMLAEQIARAVEEQVSQHGEELDVEFVEVREYAQDLAVFMSSHVPSSRLRSAQESVSGADAMVAVTPVFAASYSGLFKMFMDALDPDALTGLPVIIAATAGTARHQLVLDYAMRPLFTYLHATVMPTGVFAATEDFGGERSIEGRVARAAAELAGYIVRTSGEVVGTEKAKPESEGFQSFADLLKGHSGE